MMDFAHRTRRLGSRQVCAACHQTVTYLDRPDRLSKRLDPDMDQIVYSFDDGWTVRWVAPETVREEARITGNCLGRHVAKIKARERYLFSLRDERNQSHANLLLVPHRGNWEGGRILAMAGHENAPVTKQQFERFSIWFTSFENMPLTECPTCGDLVEGICSRCNWGRWNQSEPIEEHPKDQTRDVKPGFQSAVWGENRWRA